jgi:cholesterol oxidase
MNSHWDTDKKVPSYIPIANDFAKRMAKKVKGDPLSVLPEVLFNTSTTAHILGGCVMSESSVEGVIDHAGVIHGYKGLYVVDGSIVPVNLSVNPSLTITAMAEYIMSKISDKSS